MNGWKQNLTKNLVGRIFSAEKNFVLPDAIGSVINIDFFSFANERVGFFL